MLYQVSVSESMFHMLHYFDKKKYLQYQCPLFLSMRTSSLDALHIMVAESLEALPKNL